MDTTGGETPSSSEAADVRYWDEWNRAWRFRSDHDAFMERQAEIVKAVASAAGLSNAKVVDIGCGTGWLPNELVPFGQVTGTDLSPQALADGAERFPAGVLIARLCYEVDDHFTLAL